MATGTGNLPYPGKSYTPFDILTAEELNEDVANIESLADGSGIGDKAVTAGKIDFDTLVFGNYSTSEVDTGFKWINGKAIYKKTISLGSMPNSTTKTVAHGVTGMENLLLIQGGASDGTESLPLNIFFTTTAFLSTWVIGSNISIRSGVNYSSKTGYVTLFYTKI